MKHYTQDDIVAWQVKTFGPLKDDLTCLIRANTEMAEMLTHLNRGENEEAAIEAADVMIVLAGYAKKNDEDVFAKYFNDPPGKRKDAMTCALFANLSLALLMLSENAEDVDGPYEELRDICGFLRRALRIIGRDIDKKVVSKMAVNEAREWNCNGDGTGSHVKKTLGGAELHGVFIPAAPDDASTQEGNWVFRPGQPPEFMKKGDPRI